ncbi:MAG: hypothetical protein KC414_14225, partial [Romboutsia sp.]|nr:hypothetical protein [Romboutsia sp.]
MNPILPQIKIKEISIEDVLANDKILYNVNNLWKDNNVANKPEDYSDKLKSCNTKNWLYKFHDKASIHEIFISNKDIKWMKEASRIGQLTGDFPKMYAEELEDFCSNSNIIIPESNNNKGWFIRSETVSLKNSKHGTGPYYDLKSIIESLVTSRCGHSCLDRDIMDITLYLIP